MEINWNDFSFFPREDCFFIKEPKLVDNNSIWFDTAHSIELGIGLFRGYTDQKRFDYNEKIPRFDEASCLLYKFDVVFNGIIVNGMNLEEVKNLYKKTIINERITKLSK